MKDFAKNFKSFNKTGAKIGFYMSTYIFMPMVAIAGSAINLPTTGIVMLSCATEVVGILGGVAISTALACGCQVIDSTKSLIKKDNSEQKDKISTADKLSNSLSKTLDNTEKFLSHNKMTKKLENNKILQKVKKELSPKPTQDTYIETTFVSDVVQKKYNRKR